MKDEKKWRKQKKKQDRESIDSYDRYDGIGTNLVNSKQLRKIRLKGHRDHHSNKKYKHYYIFPVEDEVCTESQISVKYCGNCGRNGHHAVSSKSYNSHSNGHSNINIGEGDGGCSYEDNPLYINYQRKTFRRDKINKETLNRHKSAKRENDSYCKLI
jgi:hypothetical protein